MKLFTIILILAGFFQFGMAQESTSQEKVKVSNNNPMSNVIGISAEGGVTLGFTDYTKSKINYTGKASLEYYFPSTGHGNFGLRIFGQTGFVAGRGAPAGSGNTTNLLSSKFDLYGGGVFYMLSMGDAVYPWLGFGISNLWSYAKDGNGNKLPGYLTGNYDLHMLAYNGDAGVRFAVSKNISLNVNAGVIIGTKDYLDDIKAGSNNDMLYTGTVGMSYYFGRDTDADGDGVSDSYDACPNTPVGVKVDDFGCPLDSDGDGVADYLDKCAGTPSGVKVDASGCPLDSDGDGVPDYLDKCKDTPAKVVVDASGCPVDSDGDSVPDYLDKCPNTEKGVQVDQYGCPIKKEVVTDTVVVQKPAEIESLVLKGDANFETGKAILLPGAYPSLDQLAETMKLHPEYKWEISGHTDAVGSAKSNQKLSEKRAKVVLDYLLSKGLNRSSIKTIGYGESNPVAANDTPEGRAMNRRVEIKVISKGK